MMKLYYFPDACSLAPHIALRETDHAFQLAEVDYATRKLGDGSDYRDINPRGSVPALRLDSGELLTEVSVILQYIVSGSADDSRFLPTRGLARFRCLEWLNYIATELHKSVSPLFRHSTPRAFVKPGKLHLIDRYEFVERQLQHEEYLAGKRYSIADMYLFAVCRWLPALQIDIGRWPGIAAHYARLYRRAPVQAALAAENGHERSA